MTTTRTNGHPADGPDYRLALLAMTRDQLRDAIALASRYVEQTSLLVDESALSATRRRLFAGTAIDADKRRALADRVAALESDQRRHERWALRLTRLRAELARREAPVKPAVCHACAAATEWPDGWQYYGRADRWFCASCDAGTTPGVDTRCSVDDCAELDSGAPDHACLVHTSWETAPHEETAPNGATVWQTIGTHPGAFGGRQVATRRRGDNASPAFYAWTEPVTREELRRRIHDAAMAQRFDGAWSVWQERARLANMRANLLRLANRAQLRAVSDNHEAPESY